jgi:long-chain acyl-CoA synthetase
MPAAFGTRTPSALAKADFDNVASAAIDAGQTLPQLLIAACRRWGDKAAFTNLGRTLSYRQIDQASAQLAAFLRGGLGLWPGDRVAIMLPNLLQYPIALLAVLRADLIAVPVNPLYTARELRHQLKDSGASALIVVENFAATAADALEGTEVRQVLTTRVGDLLGFAKGALVDFVLKYRKRAIPPFSLPTAVRWPDAMARGARMSDGGVGRCAWRCLPVAVHRRHHRRVQRAPPWRTPR